MILVLLLIITIQIFDTYKTNYLIDVIFFRFAVWFYRMEKRRKYYFFFTLVFKSPFFIKNCIRMFCICFDS